MRVTDNGGLHPKAALRLMEAKRRAVYMILGIVLIGFGLLWCGFLAVRDVLSVMAYIMPLTIFSAGLFLVNPVTAKAWVDSVFSRLPFAWGKRAPAPAPSQPESLPEPSTGEMDGNQGGGNDGEAG